MRTVAELCAARVANERGEVAALEGATDHYANNLAREIGMTQSTAIPYASFLYLVEEASRTGP